MLAVRTSPLQVSEHEANAKAVNALFASVSRAEFSRVQGFQETHKIWICLENYHEGTPQVKALRVPNSPPPPLRLEHPIAFNNSYNYLFVLEII